MRRTFAILGLVIAAAAVALAVVGFERGAPRATPAAVVRSPASLRGPSHRRARPPRPPVRRLRHHSVPVPVLEYHVIAAPAPGAPFPQLYVAPKSFRDQMRGLARAGFHGVTLAQVFAYWDRGVPLPRRPVVVSFDDGYLSHYTQAARILRKLRWPGVENLELGDLRHKGGLTPTMVKTMIRHGWEVASHTLTHPDLTAIGPAKLRHELVGSRAELRRRFGVPADFFCYPAGRWNPRVADAVRRAGYRGATTEVPGLAQPGAPYSLARINVSQTTTAAGLLAQLR